MNADAHREPVSPKLISDSFGGPDSGTGRWQERKNAVPSRLDDRATTVSDRCTYHGVVAVEDGLH